MAGSGGQIGAAMGGQEFSWVWTVVDLSSIRIKIVRFKFDKLKLRTAWVWFDSAELQLKFIAQICDRSGGRALIGG